MTPDLKHISKMKTEDFIKQEFGIEIDEDNRFDDCELTWDRVIQMMHEFRKEGRYYSPDEIRDIQEFHYEMGFQAGRE